MIRLDLIELPTEGFLHSQYIRLMICQYTRHQRPAIVPVVDAVTFDRETDVVGHDGKGLGGGGAHETEEPEEEIAH
jgi:hypothetical protein